MWTQDCSLILKYHSRLGIFWGDVGGMDVVVVGTVEQVSAVS